jgi:hypothetical protein
MSELFKSYGEASQTLRVRGYIFDLYKGNYERQLKTGRKVVARPKQIRQGKHKGLFVITRNAADL